MSSPRGDAEEQGAQRRRDARLLGVLALAVVLLLVAGGGALQPWRTWVDS